MASWPDSRSQLLPTTLSSALLLLPPLPVGETVLVSVSVSVSASHGGGGDAAGGVAATARRHDIGHNVHVGVCHYRDA